MSQIQTGSEGNAAALVGSLATFSLFDVLELLARTGHTGELQVVARGIDQRVWVDRGDLLDASGEGSNNTALFELACVEEGWFYFTLTTSLPDRHERVPVISLLADLGPQVEEWRSLVAFLPFDARVSMSASTPAPAVQIRADQWQLLSLVGNPGHTIRAVIDSSDLHPLSTLRTLRELIDAQLVTMVLTAPPLASPSSVGLFSGASSPLSSTADLENLRAPTEPEGTARHSEPARSAGRPGEPESGAGAPAPRAEGPGEWSEEPSAEPGPEAAPATAPVAVTTEPADGGPTAPGTGPAPIPPPAGYVAHDESVEGPVAPTTGPPPAEGTKVGASARPARASSNGSAMPPPITGDPWSAGGAAGTPSDDKA